MFIFKYVYMNIYVNNVYMHAYWNTEIGIPCYSYENWVGICVYEIPPL